MFSLAACSGGNATDPDGGSGTVDGSNTDNDGSVPPDAAGSATVIVTGVTAANGPVGYVADIPIVVFRPDGSIAVNTVTDANGSATVPVEEGWLIARVNNAKMFYENESVDSVIASPGKTYRFGRTVPAQPGTTVGQLVVSWPARSVPGYTVYYSLITPCGGGETTSTSMSIQLRSDCAAGPFNIAVTSRRSSQGTRYILTRQNVQPAANVTVSFASETWLGVIAPQVQISNVPAGASAYCSHLQHLGDMEVFGDSYTVNSTGCWPMVLDAPGTTVAFNTRFVRGRFAVETQRVYPHNAVPTIDASGQLPWITGVTYDTATRNVTWTAETPGAFDGSILEVSTYSRRWRVYASGALPAAWRLPVLPAEYAEYDIPVTGQTFVRLYNRDIDGLTPDEVMQRDDYADDWTWEGANMRLAFGGGE